ncbi:hypothetical protein FisN_2Hu098 [Fistulifera solaris]|uniref:Uncharacterized protein n=1 Tax=Fistulifera solaris TaxID=1519565 RepID=A0A1Z5KP34_FISSO|nr:hypothetical protein FisN_2Hu098 [Fistulifera solaris]|eukprot:GAX28084.1 hypothetical protein FisN_2Hu098 [Fistulifera solaris]
MHREVCKAIADINKKVRQEELLFLSSAPFEDLFVTNAGLFWNLPEAQTYMETTYDAATAFWGAAFDSNVKQVWEKVLDLFLEHMRLGANDQMGARYQVPFLLIALNRDDDAFSFCQYWLKINEVVDSNPETIFERHLHSREGDWIYPREKDCRYLDPLPLIAGRDMQSLVLPFLVAFVIIKLRIVAAHDSAVHCVKVALEGKSGQRIKEVQSLIEGMLTRKDINIDRQREQIHELFDAIHLRNPSMLPAFINPMPLTMFPPSDFTPGHPSEVVKILMECQKSFTEIPGALEILKDRFGSSPVYNWDVR